MTIQEFERTAVVTGGEGSIGQSVVGLLRDRGVRVVSADLARAAGRPQPQDSENPSYTAYDARDPDSARSAIEAAGGRVDYLILAAGIYPACEFADLGEDEWQGCLDINLTAVYRMIKAALPRLSRDASIVLVGSIAGLRGSKDHAHYATSKAGLLGLMRSVMWELGGQRRINMVSPGIIDNPMTRSLREAAGDTILHNTPLGRYGTAEEVAAVIGFLCSPGASFIQGENISVNGGFYVN